MRKITAIVILCLLPSLSNSAQETKEISKNSNSSSTEDYTKFRYGGYGEMVANIKDYGINRFSVQRLSLNPVEQVQLSN